MMELSDARTAWPDLTGRRAVTTGADFRYPDCPPGKQRRLIEEHRMVRAKDIVTAMSLMHVETRRAHP